MTSLCGCDLTRKLDADGRCARCASVMAIVAANPVPASRERESSGEARSTLLAADSRSRGRTNGIPVSTGNSGRGPHRLQA